MKTAQASIMDIVNPTMKDVYQIAGVTEEEIIPFKDPKNKRQRKANAFSKCDLINEVVNNGWTADYSDGKPKYEPIFEFNGSGFGFSNADCVGWNANTDVGSPLVYETRDKARFAGTNFQAEYNELYKNI